MTHTRISTRDQNVCTSIQWYIALTNNFVYQIPSQIQKKEKNENTLVLDCVYCKNDLFRFFVDRRSKICVCVCVCLCKVYFHNIYILLFVQVTIYCMNKESTIERRQFGVMEIFCVVINFS